jgi:hypothetical protein
MLEHPQTTGDKSALPCAIYEITLGGRLEGEYWTRCFDGMTVSFDQRGNSVLRGPIEDQAALYGLLARLRDLALPLLSVTRDNCNHGSEHDTTIEEDEETYWGVY